MNLACDHDNRRRLAASAKVTNCEREIVRLFCVMHGSDPLAVALKAYIADRDALNKELDKKSRVDDLEPMRAEVVEVG